MANSSNDWETIVRTMMRDAGMSHRKISVAMGKSPTYMGAMLRNYREGAAPSADILAGMAHACGFEVHVTGHGRDMLIRP